MKIADSALSVYRLSLFMEIMKSATSHTPSTGLSGIQFSILNVLESLIAKDQKKYNNTEMKSGRLFYGRHTGLNIRCCEYKHSGKSQSLEGNQTKIKK